MSDTHEHYHHLKWQEQSRKTIAETPIFDVVQVDRDATDGRRGSFVFVSSADWAHIIAVVSNDEGRDCFLMVRQYRQGGECITLEFPGGIIDGTEDASVAALRELKEETGFTADRAERIGATNPNPAIMDNKVHTFLAHGVRRDSAQDLDPNEIVDVELVPVDDILAGHRQEFAVHAIMLAGLYWYRAHAGR